MIFSPTGSVVFAEQGYYDISLGGSGNALPRRTCRE
jgi:hypothetical protein